MADRLFAEAYNAFQKISKKISLETVDKVSELKHKIGKLERMLQEEKAEFEVLCIRFLCTSQFLG